MSGCCISLVLSHDEHVTSLLTGPTEHIPITNGSPVMSGISSDVSSPQSSNESDPHSPVSMRITPPYTPYQSHHSYQPTHSDYQQSSESKLPSFLTSLLTMGDGPKVVMCVLMMFTLALVPTSVFISGGSSEDYQNLHGPGRHLSSFSDSTAGYTIFFLMSVVFRVCLAWLSVGWLVAHSLPGTLPVTSRQYSSFWKFAKEGSTAKQRVSVFNPPHSILPHSLPPHSLPPHSIPPHSILPHSILPHYIIPHSISPHSILPHSILPHSIIPHSIIPHSIPPHSIIPHSLPPHSIPPHSILPHSIPPHSIIPHSIIPHSIPPHSILPHSILPHSILPHSIPPHSILPHFIPPHFIPPCLIFFSTILLLFCPTLGEVPEGCCSLLQCSSCSGHHHGNVLIYHSPVAGVAGDLLCLHPPSRRAPYGEVGAAENLAEREEWDHTPTHSTGPTRVSRGSHVG